MGRMSGQNKLESRCRIHCWSHSGSRVRSNRLRAPTLLYELLLYGYDYHHHHHDFDGGGWGGGWGATQTVTTPASVADMTTPAGPSRMDGFFVVEPGVNLDFNMTHTFRLSLGGSYRWIKGVNSTASTDKELTGPSAMITFRFGRF